MKPVMDQSGVRRWVPLVVTLLVGIAAGVMVGRAFTEESPRQEPSKSGTSLPRGVTGPTDLRNGVPVGYGQSAEGAVAAASNYARVMTGASGDPAAYRRALRTLASPDWLERAEELATNTIDFVRSRYGTDGSATFSPVRYRVAAFSKDLATIDIWGVLVASGPKIEGVDESWLIATVELAWVETDWRVVGQSAAPGPTPELLRTADAQSESILTDFEEYQVAPQP